MYAAGILPFCYIKGSLWFLLGEEDKTQEFSDFGGLKMDGDTDVVDTAIREFTEETYGMILDKDYLYNVLKTSKCIKCDSRNEWTRYYMFLVEISYNELLPIYFKRAINFQKYLKTRGFISNFRCEKTDIRWINAENFFDNNSLRFRDMFLHTIRSNREEIMDPYLKL